MSPDYVDIVSGCVVQYIDSLDQKNLLESATESRYVSISHDHVQRMPFCALLYLHHVSRCAGRRWCNRTVTFLTQETLVLSINSQPCPPFLVSETPRPYITFHQCKRPCNLDSNPSASGVSDHRNSLGVSCCGNFTVNWQVPSKL